MARHKWFINIRLDRANRLIISFCSRSKCSFAFVWKVNYSGHIIIIMALHGLESREYGRRDLSCWPRGTLYPQKLALTSPTSGGRSVGVVRSWTQATEFSLVLETFIELCLSTCDSVGFQFVARTFLPNLSAHVCLATWHRSVTVRAVAE
jgi:hypothetical protein